MVKTCHTWLLATVSENYFRSPIASMKSLYIVYLGLLLNGVLGSVLN